LKGLRDGHTLKEAKGLGEELPRGLHVAQVNREHLGNPRGLTKAPADTLTGTIVQAAHQVPQQGGNNTALGRRSDEADDPTRDRHLSPVVLNPGEQRMEG
jgi:hypothetical protein